MKKVPVDLVGRITAIILLAAALLTACFGSIQATRSIFLPLGFKGEYSLDSGETWQTLSEDTDIPAEYGSVILKGSFGIGFPEGANLHFYLDHITMDIFIDGEQVFDDSRNEIGLNSTTCGRVWRHWLTPEISEDDIVEIHLANPHKFGNTNAYNELLDSVYGGSEEAFSSFMMKKSKLSRMIGVSLMVAAIMLLAVALFFGLMHINGGAVVGNMGAAALFFGGYYILDNVDISLWSWLDAFNTYALQICIMLAALSVAACIAGNLNSKAKTTAEWAVFASAAVNITAAVLSLLGVMVIYDTAFFCLAAHILIYAVLFGCCIYECKSGKVSDRLTIVSDFALIIAAFADIILFAADLSHEGMCSKAVFLILFLIHLVRIIKVIPMNYNAAREAEHLRTELAENRISIMLSQIQPHFLYNSLNTIYGLCEKDPSAAKEAVNDFADYLRGNMDSLSRKVPVPFETELRHLKAYLALEKMRFKNKLEIVWDIETDSFMLPALTVQPLVENAVKHGICGSEKGGTVRISARELADCFEVEISDNGTGFDPAEEKCDGKTHLGIDNVRNRLWKMSRATLEITSEPGKGTDAVIRIPKDNTDRRTERNESGEEGAR
ncbi:MAG: sensor histidine kinase [Huintestinicola sp.]|uniref:sensor histidine kinase n=1 Tax=Huintestinicola sp. TaxID=2981661 RepID=UPI003F0E1FC4